MGVWLGILGMAFALAMDAFAVSIATGIRIAPPRCMQTLRVAVCFGLFQCFMPVIGWLTGRELAAWVAAWDHWVAFALLLAVGGKMIHDALATSDAKNLERQSPDPTRGMVLLMLGVATSIDAFAVGVSMAMLQRPIWIPCIIFGLVAAALSVVGMRYGGRIGRRVGRRAELAGGIVLILIGLATLVSHLIE